VIESSVVSMALGVPGGPLKVIFSINSYQTLMTKQNLCNIPGGSNGCLALIGSVVWAGSEVPYWFSATTLKSTKLHKNKTN
jgi:hypothetical protein